MLKAENDSATAPEDHSATDVEPRHVVVLVHGIRTQGPWAEMVKSVLEKQARVYKVVPIRYGYFHIFRFLSPFFTRQGPIRTIARQLRDVRKQYPDARISVIAHSYGTYAMAKVLDDATDIQLYRLILCGSIVPQDFRWDKIAEQVDSEIVNDCGSRDVWPIMAKAMTWGFGPSGTFGFGKTRVRDRFHRFTHSDFFQEQFVTQFWVPYIRDGTIIGSDWETQRPAPPFWHSFLALVKLPVVVLLLAGVLVAWPSGKQVVENRAMKAILLAPDPQMRDRLAPVGGELTTPMLLRLQHAGRTYAVDTLRQRIYLAGGRTRQLEQLATRTPKDTLFAGIKDFARSKGASPSEVDGFLKLLTDPRPGLIETGLMKSGDRVRVQVVHDPNGRNTKLFDKTITLATRRVTTVILESGNE